MLGTVRGRQVTAAEWEMLHAEAMWKGWKIIGQPAVPLTGRHLALRNEIAADLADAEKEMQRLKGLIPILRGLLDAYNTLIVLDEEQRRRIAG